MDETNSHMGKTSKHMGETSKYMGETSKYMDSRQELDSEVLSIRLWKEEPKYTRSQPKSRTRSLPRRRNGTIQNIHDEAEEEDDLSGCQRMVLWLRELRAKKWFLHLHLLVTFVFGVALIANDPLSHDSTSLAVILGCHCVYGVFTIIRLLSCQSIHWGWCPFELLAIASGISLFFVRDPMAIRCVKAASCLRLVIMVRTTSLNTPLRNLLNAMKNVNKIIFPSLILIYLYSLIGLYAFADREYNRCRTPDQQSSLSSWTWQQSINYLCGSRQCPVVNGQQLQCLNPYVGGVRPDPSETSELWLGYGLLVYKNIFYALFNTYRLVFLTGWSRNIILMKQTMNEYIVFLYYISFIYIVSYIYMNILYGMMMLNEHTNNPKKISYISCDPEVRETARKRHNNQDNQLHFDENVLIAFRKKSEDSVIMWESRDLAADFLCLRRDFYLPSNQRWRLVATQLIKAYCTFNHFMIVAACLKNFLLDGCRSNTMVKVSGALDIVFMVQFAVHVLGRVFMEVLTEEKVKSWCKRHKLPLPSRHDEFSGDLKVEVCILLLCFTGVLHEIYFMKELSDLLVANQIATKILRSCIYLRIFVLLLRQHYFLEWKIIIKSAFKIVRLALPFIIFYLLMILVFSIVAYHLFHRHPTQPSASVYFNSLVDCIIYVFLIFYNEGWDTTMFQEYEYHGVLLLIFQLVTATIGVVFLSKYFMAFLVNEFINQLEKAEDIASNNATEETTYASSIALDLATENMNGLRVQPMAESTQCNLPSEQCSGLRKSSKAVKEKEPKTTKLKRRYKTCLTPKVIGEDEKREEEGSNSEPDMRSRLRWSGRRILRSNMYGYVYGCFLLAHLIEMGNCGPLVDRLSHSFAVFQAVDKVCTSFFALDCVLYSILFGVWDKEEAFLRKIRTNALNLIILPFGLLMFIPPLAQVEWIYKLSKLKALRILIVLERLSEQRNRLKLVIVGYMKLLPKVLSFLILLCIFYGFFAVLLTKIYSNKFWYCANSAAGASVDTKWDCLKWGGDWVEQQVNTNDSLSALKYVMLIASTEGWMTLMNFMASIRGQDLNPQPNYNYFIQFFFLFFFFFGNMIVLNLFIGLSIHNMNKITKKEKGAERLSQSEEEWLMIKEKIHSLKLLPSIKFPHNSLRYFCEVLVKSMTYKVIKFIIILLFLARLSILRSGMGDSFTSLILRDQFIFTLISLLSFIIESLARKRRRDPLIWVFNLAFYGYTLVLACLYFVRGQPGFMHDEALRFCGITLIAFQLFKYWFYLYELHFVRKTLKFMQIIMPHAICNTIPMVAILLLYTYLGIELFPYLRPNSELNDYDQNYTTFFKGFFSLIKFSTWEAPIDQIANAAQPMTPNFICFEIDSYGDYLRHGRYGCGSQLKSYLFFFSFHIIYSMIMLSSLLANIFNSYCEVKKQEEITVNEFQLERVLEEWTNFDPEASGFLPYHHFWRFMSKIHFIYGLSGERVVSIEDKSEFLSLLNIPIYQVNGTLSFEFYETVEGLIRMMLSKKYREPLGQNKADFVFELVNEIWDKKLKKSPFTSKHVFCIIQMRKGLRIWRNKSTIGFVPTIFSHSLFKPTSKPTTSKPAK